MTTCDFTGIGLVITLFVMLYNNKQTNNRETRKEIRAKLDQLNILLTRLIDSTKKYYLDPNALLTIETVSIHEIIQTCDRYIEELSKHKDGISLNADFYIIYDMITGGNFESKNHRAGDHHTEHCKKISIQKESLITKAENWFNQKFH